MNDRYQDGGPAGTSKKSASTVKPARPAASTVYEKSGKMTPSEKRKADREARRAAEAKQREEDQKAREEGRSPAQVRDRNLNANPEYIKWRRVWWALLGLAVLFTILSFFLQSSATADADGNYVANPVSYVTLIFAYAAIIAAFVIDFKKIRKLRIASEGGSGQRSPKQIKHDEEQKRMEEARQAAKAAKRRQNPVVRTASNAADAVKSKVPGGSKDAETTAEAAEKTSSTTVKKAETSASGAEAAVQADAKKTNSSARDAAKAARKRAKSVAAQTEDGTAAAGEAKADVQAAAAKADAPSATEAASGEAAPKSE